MTTASHRYTDLRRTLHLVVDAALVADDAITRDDADALWRAIDVITRHAETLRALAAGTDDA